MWLQGIKDKLFKLFMQDILRRLNYMYMEYFWQLVQMEDESIVFINCINGWNYTLVDLILFEPTCTLLL